MKRIRLAFLVFVVALVGLRSTQVRASGCCNDFVVFCNGVCYNNGGTLLADCHVGMDNLEVCWCANDGAEPSYSGGPHYCAA